MEKVTGIILQGNKHKDEDDDKDEDEELSNLEKAYIKLKENKTLTESEEAALIDFVDRAVTCTLNPELAAKMVDINKDKEYGKKIIEIVKACMIHYHTKACAKYGNVCTCRFRFPKFPMWKTILTTSNPEAGTNEGR